MLAGVIAVALAGIGYLLVFDDGNDDDSPDGDGRTAAGASDPDDEPSVDDSDEASSSGGEDTNDPERLTGTWEGAFTCAEGPSDAVLTLDDYGDGTIGAAWEFEADDGGSGRFHLDGTYEGGQLSLTPLDWVDGYELDGYDMLHLEADLSDRTDTELLEADIPGDDCTDISLERTTPEPWYAGTWEGAYFCNELEGKGGLRLTIDTTAQDKADVVVNYFRLPDSTADIPNVRHEAEASYTDRSLIMTAGEWIDDPQGYVAVDILSYEEAPTNPYKLVGVLDYPGCSLFTLDLLEDEDGESATDGADD